MSSGEDFDKYKKLLFRVSQNRHDVPKIPPSSRFLKNSAIGFALNVQFIAYVKRFWLREVNSFTHYPQSFTQRFFKFFVDKVEKHFNFLKCKVVLL